MYKSSFRFRLLCVILKRSYYKIVRYKIRNFEYRFYCISLNVTSIFHNEPQTSQIKSLTIYLWMYQQWIIIYFSAIRDTSVYLNRLRKVMQFTVDFCFVLC